MEKTFHLLNLFSVLPPVVLILPFLLQMTDSLRWRFFQQHLLKVLCLLSRHPLKKENCGRGKAQLWEAVHSGGAGKNERIGRRVTGQLWRTNAFDRKSFETTQGDLDSNLQHTSLCTSLSTSPLLIKKKIQSRPLSFVNWETGNSRKKGIIFSAKQLFSNFQLLITFSNF